MPIIVREMTEQEPTGELATTVTVNSAPFMAVAPPGEKTPLFLLMSKLAMRPLGIHFALTTVKSSPLT